MKSERCAVCDKAIKPIWYSDKKDPETYFYLECDRCNEYVCEDCSWMDDNDTERVCSDCYQTEINQLFIAELKKKEGKSHD